MNAVAAQESLTAEEARIQDKIATILWRAIRHGDRPDHRRPWPLEEGVPTQVGGACHPLSCVARHGGEPIHEQGDAAERILGVRPGFSQDWLNWERTGEETGLGGKAARLIWEYEDLPMITPDGPPPPGRAAVPPG